MADKYNLKVPLKLVEFFKNYINEHKELGYTFVSKYLLKLLQDEAERLMREKNKKEEKKIVLPSGEYTREELEKIIREN